MTSPTVDEEHLLDFITELNQAMPSLRVRLDHVLRVYAGFLPARRAGSERQAARAVFCDHAAMGGPVGLYSVSGVKYTTARLIAEQTLDRVFGHHSGREGLHRKPRPIPAQIPAADDLVRSLPIGDDLQVALQNLIDAESVVHLDDLLLRRTDWAEHPELLDRLIGVVWGACGWDETRRITERARLALALRHAGSPWAGLAVDRAASPKNARMGQSVNA